MSWIASREPGPSPLEVSPDWLLVLVASRDTIALFCCTLKHDMQPALSATCHMLTSDTCYRTE